MNTNSRPVMNPPVCEAEAGNRVNAAPGQADRDAARRGVSGPTSRPEARPVMPTARRPSVDPKSYELAEYFLSDLEGDEASEDQVWQLAGEIQQAVEDWFENGSSSRESGKHG